MKRTTWADIVLGGWLIASPFVFGYSASSPITIAEDFLPAAFLFVSSWWIVGVRIAPLRANWLQALDGLWLIVGSFVMLFARVTSGAANELIVGLLVLFVSLTAAGSLLSRTTSGQLMGDAHL